MADQLDCALDLMRRLPPQNTEDNLASLVDLAPHLAEELLSTVDQPLRVQRCPKTGRDYLVCDYNRDGDAYRSPWSNEYDPPLVDGSVPSSALRKLEVAANEAFDTYREMYYEGGISSVYFWDMDAGFAGVVLIKKVNDADAAITGTWDSIHVFETSERSRSAHYKLTSTIMLYTKTENSALGQMNLSGSLTRQAELTCVLDDYSAHIGNIGSMIEDMESKMRNALQQVYFGKTRDVINDLRSLDSLDTIRQQSQMQKELFTKLLERRATTDN
ncbi:F-actin-capping protein subunit beta [Syncephalis pseudoplumigaleata]|uniref:F-actin-capping protein subunit beta n=1 Tax=Syncephalis pseudoplumigaleata TaxID=1712513 RepID=A0A4P9YZI5_9FUNG|nr:F-actin-capping protein subunit beta [Syncephalis pseudoplumigaleata]|eukprot:RKP25593.1 F-actin-capping protein subunit beta [Syncephalis pseudoplumigaleata]